MAVPNLHTLPPEIIYNIMEELDWWELKAICHTSTVFYQIAQSLDFWKNYLKLHKPNMKSNIPEKIIYYKRLIVSGRLYIAPEENLDNYRIVSNNNDIYQIAGSKTLLAYVTALGDLYIIHTSTSRFSPRIYLPTMIKCNEPVRQLACGYDHMVFITMSGELYGWGSNKYGQLGKEGIGDSFDIPVRMGSGIKQAKCGPYYTIWLNSTGQVYFIGNGIGLPNIREPLKLNIGNGVGLSANYDHLAIIDATGEVFLYGNNHRGQLGVKSIKNINLRDGPIFPETNR